MSTAIATQNGHSPGEVMERVLGAGDLSKLSNEQRAHYIVKVCESAGLNPLTRPFDIITLNGKPTLYASKGATDQLRRLHNITLRIVDQQRIEDVWQVTVEATTPDGRTDTDIGVVALGGAKGEALANTLMKAVTKAKRRVTLSICGLGLLDESEFDTIPRQAFAPDAPHNAPQAHVAPLRAMPAPVVDADRGTGEIQPPIMDSVKKDTARLAGLLKFAPKDVAAYAKTINANYRTVEGATALRDALEAMLEAQQEAQEAKPAHNDDEEDYEGIEAASAEQPTLLDAETAVIDRWAD